MYKVIELQSYGDSTAHLVFDAATSNEAQSKYHQVLAAAAISNVEVHAACILNNEGRLIMQQAYYHPQPEPEPEPEPESEPETP